jgi:creatinine amidohydrolase
MTQWYEWGEMTSVEIAHAKPHLRLALIPVGATEQHGPNLATATDYRVAHAFAQRIAAAVHPRAIVLPPLPFGISHHHMQFAGTITLSAESFIAMCTDVAKSIRANGIEHLIFVNGHMGNTAILNVVTTKLHYELGLHAATSFYFQQAADKLKQYGQTPRFGHACEVETSVLMALCPQLVRKDALTPGDMLPVTRRYTYTNQPYALQTPIGFHEQTRNGAFGDARLASPEIGEDIIGTALARTVEFIDDFLKEGA